VMKTTITKKYFARCLNACFSIINFTCKQIFFSLQSSVFCLLSSVFCLLSSVFCFLFFLRLCGSVYKDLLILLSFRERK
jgi:hypothetical protein